MSVSAAAITEGQFASHGEAVVMPASRFGLADMSAGTRLFRMAALAVIATLGLTVLSALEKRASGGVGAAAGGRAEGIGVGVSGTGAKAGEPRQTPPARLPAAAGQARGGSAAIARIPPAAARRTGTDDDSAEL